jgi:hypothetical protein
MIFSFYKNGSAGYFTLAIWGAMVFWKMTCVRLKNNPILISPGQASHIGTIIPGEGRLMMSAGSR